jgi:NADP-dependent 3-hydroxy acid dehydrogenase YdfG
MAMYFPDEVSGLEALAERVFRAVHMNGRARTALSGTAALVTGASSGIGAATAVMLAAHGAKVALVARRIDRLEALAGHIHTCGGEALPFQADITEPAGATGVVGEAVERLGRLDTLVNNAGIMLLGPALESPLDEWERTVALNVSGTLRVTHAALPHLVAAAEESPRRVADLVMVSSTAGRVARPGAAVYALTKSGVTAFAESLRQELVPRRMRVTVIEPGTVDTELVSHVREGVREAARDQVAGIDPLLPDDVGEVIAHIVTRDRRVAVNEVLVRAAEQSW